MFKFLLVFNNNTTCFLYWYFIEQIFTHLHTYFIISYTAISLSWFPILSHISMQSEIDIYTSTFAYMNIAIHTFSFPFMSTHAYVLYIFQIFWRWSRYSYILYIVININIRIDTLRTFHSCLTIEMTSKILGVK